MKKDGELTIYDAGKYFALKFFNLEESFWSFVHSLNVSIRVLGIRGVLKRAPDLYEVLSICRNNEGQILAITSRGNRMAQFELDSITLHNGIIFPCGHMTQDRFQEMLDDLMKDLDIIVVPLY